MQKFSLAVLLVLCWSAIAGAAYDVKAIRVDRKFFTKASCSHLKSGVLATEPIPGHGHL